MADLGPLNLVIKVNKDTGQLEVFGQEISKLGSTFQSVFGTIGNIGTGAGLALFFTEAIKDASEYENALSRLGIQLKNAGVNFEQAQPQVEAWAQSIQDLTRFSETQAVNALDQVLAKTHDLNESEKLTQLAMDVSVAKGKDFNTVLSEIATAAGGSQRGIMMLQREIGEGAVGVKDAAELFQMLADQYGNAAEKSNTFTDAQAKARNQVEQVQREIGGALLPAIADLLGILPRIAGFFGDGVAVVQGFFSAIYDGVVGIAATSVPILETLGKAVVDLARGNIKQLQQDLAEGWGSVKEVSKATLDNMTSDVKKSADEVMQIETGLNQQKKAALVELSNFKHVTGQADLIENKQVLDQELKNATEQTKLDLEQKNLWAKQRLAIIDTNEDAEIDIIDAAEEQKTITATVAETKRNEVHIRASQERLKVEQKNTIDLIAELEKWRDQSLQIQAELLAAGKQVSDSFTKGFSDSFARTIIEGKSFQEQMSALNMQIEEQIISSLVRIAVQAAITKAAVEAALLF